MFITQREYLKYTLILLAKEQRLYGLEMYDFLVNDLAAYGYKPSRSEVYKSLHQLMDSGIITRAWKNKTGAKLQQVAIYVLLDKVKAQQILDEAEGEMEQLKALIEKTLKTPNSMN